MFDTINKMNARRVCSLVIGVLGIVALPVANVAARGGGGGGHGGGGHGGGFGGGGFHGGGFGGGGFRGGGFGGRAPAAIGEHGWGGGGHWGGHYGHYGRRYGYYGGFYGFGWPYYDYGWPYYDYGWPYDYDYGYYPDYYYSQPSTTVIIRQHGSLDARVQRALKNDGYYRGAIDGDIGPESRAAIRGYQRAHGLPQTGEINNSLLRSLKL